MQMKFCLACNKELIGRTDKKFCDAQCRSTYHNKNRPIHEITIQRTNSSLRKNRTLLAHFSPSGKTTVKKEILLKSGYRFDVFTD
jgi:DNA-directed RNA polymerase subunit M/transcription elongation factor TFIIS